MNGLVRIGNIAVDLLDKLRNFDFVGLLALRIYLAPIFILAGLGKLSALEDTAYFFGEYLGLPAPMLMATLAGVTEFVGGIALVVGLGVRFWAAPLMFTMVVAAATAHWDKGWHALPEKTLMVPWEWRADLIDAALERKEQIKSLLSEHGDYDQLTDAGNVTILKNGIEFAATYFVMLLVLFFFGAGRYLSVDYWIASRFRKPG